MPPGTPLHVHMPKTEDPAPARGPPPAGGGKGGKGDKSIMNRLKNMLP